MTVLGVLAGLLVYGCALVLLAFAGWACDETLGGDQ